MTSIVIPRFLVYTGQQGVTFTRQTNEGFSLEFPVHPDASHYIMDIGAFTGFAPDPTTPELDNPAGNTAGWILYARVISKENLFNISYNYKVPKRGYYLGGRLYAVISGALIGSINEYGIHHVFNLGRVIAT